MKANHLVGLIVGIPTLLWLWHMTDWKIVLAIFLLLFANNLSQDES